MNIDPHEMDNDELKMELDRELSELSPEDLNLLDVTQPSQPKADDKGRIPGRIIEIRGSDVFVDIGGKSEAFLKIDEFAEDTPPEPGQLHTFMTQGLDRESGMTRLSLREAKTRSRLRKPPGR